MRVSLGLHLGFHVGGSYQDFFKVSLGFTYIGPLGFHLGYKQERIKQKKMKKQRGSKDRKQRSREARSRAAKHMTEERKNVE